MIVTMFLRLATKNDFGARKGPLLAIGATKRQSIWHLRINFSSSNYVGVGLVSLRFFDLLHSMICDLKVL